MALCRCLGMRGDVPSADLGLPNPRLTAVRLRPRPSSSTASRPIAGAFSSGRTLTRSTKWCASRRNAPTTSRSSTNSPWRRGGPSASLSRTPNRASRVDHRPICVRCEDMRAGDAAAPFVSWPTRAKLLNHRRLSSRARCTLPMASCDLGPCTDGFR